jgi:hypothetical protein
MVYLTRRWRVLSVRFADVPQLRTMRYLLLRLGILILLLISRTAVAQVTEGEILGGLLENQAPSLEMDVNQDGVVDVADLVRVSRGERIAYFVEAASTEVDRTITRDVEIRFSDPFTGTLVYSVTGSATPGVDYTALPGTLVVDGTSAFIPVHILKDLLFENRETVEITIEPGTGYTVGHPATHVLTIQDIEVHFEEATKFVREGSGTVELGVGFNYPFSGILKYSVKGTATLGQDYLDPLAGSVVVDGAGTSIPLEIVDDLDVENTEFITVDLKFNFDVTDSDIDYHLGVPSRALVLLQDNDTVWVGSMMTDNSEETFQMLVRTNGTETYASIISATNPSAKVGFISAGTIPGGTWEASSAHLEASSLFMAYGPVPLGKFQLFGGVDFQRSIEFSVDTSSKNHVIWKDALLGEFTSVIEPVAPGKSYLRRVETGPVLLIRGMSQLPFPEHEILNQ